MDGLGMVGRMDSWQFRCPPSLRPPHQTEAILPRSSSSRLAPIPTSPLPCSCHCPITIPSRSSSLFSFLPAWVHFNSKWQSRPECFVHHLSISIQQGMLPPFPSLLLFHSLLLPPPPFLPSIVDYSAPRRTEERSARSSSTIHWRLPLRWNSFGTLFVKQNRHQCIFFARCNGMDPPPPRLTHRRASPLKLFTKRLAAANKGQPAQDVARDKGWEATYIVVVRARRRKGREKEAGAHLDGLAATRWPTEVMK